MERAFFRNREQRIARGRSFPYTCIFALRRFTNARFTNSSYPSRIYHALRIMERTLFPPAASLQLNITLIPAHWCEIAQVRLPYFDVQRFICWFLRQQSTGQRSVTTKKANAKRDGRVVIPTEGAPFPYFCFSCIQCVRKKAPRHFHSWWQNYLVLSATLLVGT